MLSSALRREEAKMGAQLCLLTWLHILVIGILGINSFGEDSLVIGVFQVMPR